MVESKRERYIRLLKSKSDLPFVEFSFDAVKEIIELLEEPERKTGYWYKPTGMMPPEYTGVYRCSNCEEIAPRDWKTHKQTLTNFCPNCGADMRGEIDAE